MQLELTVSDVVIRWLAGIGNDLLSHNTLSRHCCDLELKVNVQMMRTGDLSCRLSALKT